MGHLNSLVTHLALYSIVYKEVYNLVSLPTIQLHILTKSSYNTTSYTYQVFLQYSLLILIVSSHKKGHNILLSFNLFSLQ